MQVTKDAAKDLEVRFPNLFSPGLYDRLFDPATNIAAGSAYLSLRYKTFPREKGNLRAALAGYGTGEQYADDVLECERRLKAGDWQAARAAARGRR
jgi:soluble lytic murein transglycosylase-like protein